MIVVPARLSGFGPYAEVLEGLDYVGTSGLLPHPLITEWIRARALGIACIEEWESPLGACDGSDTHPDVKEQESRDSQ